jgi:HK97 family phage prohead protease
MEQECAVLDKVVFNFPLDIMKQGVEEGEFHIVGYAATSDFDLQGDIITEEALRASQLDLLKNSTVLLNHDVTLPIGRVTKAEFDTRGLLIDVLISKTEPDVIQKIKEGVLNKFSIRGQVLDREKKFIPELDKVVNVIKRMSLVEVSLVSVPANPEAKAIGWYISKALSDQDEQEKGGTNMPKEEVVIEKISDEKETPAPEPIPAPALTGSPESGSKETATAPAPVATPSPEEVSKARSTKDEEVKKQGVMAHLDLVWGLLDRMIGIGGEASALAVQAKSLLKWTLGDATFQIPVPNPMPGDVTPKGLSKDEMETKISDEVKKQLESALKSVPAMRKGLIQPEPEAEDIKKKFEGLPPEKKLRVALALQQ